MSDEVIAVLQASEMFRTLSTKRLKEICELGREFFFPAGCELMAQGDDAGRFFLILEGTAEVSIAGRKRVTLGPGAALGEIALLDGGPRSATVTASTDVRAFSLASWNFRPILNEPDVTEAIMALLCRRLRAAEGQAGSIDGS